MIKSVLTHIATKSLSILFVICLMTSGMRSQAQVTYFCQVIDSLPSGVVQFRITAYGTSSSDVFTLENVVNMYSNVDPDIAISDGFVIPEKAGNPDIHGRYVFQTIGYSFDGILPYARLYMNGQPMSTELELISCLSPTTNITGDMSICLGMEAELHLSVSNPNLIADSTMWSTTGMVISSSMDSTDNLRYRVLYAEPGNHLVSVSGKTTNGFNFSADAIINVYDVSADWEITGKDYICTAQSEGQIYNINNPDSIAVVWSSNPAADMITPLTGSGSQVQVDFPMAAGFYVLSVENADPDGCLVDVDYVVEIVDAIDTISIIGERYVCLGDSALYSLYNMYENVQWSVSPNDPPGMGGFDLRPADGMADEVEILFSEPGTYDVTVMGDISNDPDACPFESTITVRVPDENVPQIACNNSVNVALDENCSLQLEADMILEGDFDDNDAYELIIVDAASGDTLPSDMLTEDLLGHTFIVTVTQKCGGNSCWGTLVAEDKSITRLECPSSTSTTCFELNDNTNPVGFPLFDVDVTWVYRPATEDWLVSGFDNCSDVILSYTDVNLSEVCADPQLVQRTWVAEDVNNGLTTFCTVDIFVGIVDQTSIMWPPNWDSGLNADADGDPDTDNTFNSLDACDVNNPPELMCGSQWMDNVDENGNPSPECTGYPIGLLCDNLQLVGYRDQIIPICASSRKILRRWTVWDVCAEETVMYTQIITLMDVTAPVCTPPETDVVYTGLHSCQSSIQIAPPIVTNECSGWSYNVRYKTETVQGNNPSGYTSANLSFNPTTNTYTINNLPFDSDYLWVEYVVIDKCGNRAEPCYADFELIDNEQPIPACDFNTAVALNNDGVAHAGPATFDDSSWDNCGIYMHVIQRMNDRCGCYERKLDFMYQLGGYNGHYYYLSKEKVNGRRAFAYAEALDGYVAVINDDNENNWIREQVNLFTPDQYYIGLRGDTLPDIEWIRDNDDFDYDYLWDGSEPSVDPEGKGDVFVVVNADRTWDAGYQTERDAYYVVEFEEKCGWTQKVHFCCEDVKEETMVAMKVIDFDGNHNFCMVNVNVQDFIPPVIECPEDITINCDREFDLDNLDEFGTAQGFDDCEVTVTELPPSYIQFSCEQGRIIRTFEAKDKYGNRQVCQQNIEIINILPFTGDAINWPTNVEVNSPCSLLDYDPGNNIPSWDEAAYPCSNITYTHDDLLFDVVEGACQKLVRTWTVVDWCQPGKEWNYAQVIKLKNTKAPTISPATCAPITVEDGLPVEPCGVLVEDLIASLVADAEVCADDPEWWYQIDYDNDGSVNATGTGNDASGLFPYGTHALRWFVRDDCDNVATCVKLITVRDNLPPTPYCHGQIVIPVNATEGVEIWASDLDLGSWDNCPDHEVFLSFEENILVTNLTLSCDDLQDSMTSGIVYVDLWVWDNINSSLANKSYCTVGIIIQDNQNLCNTAGNSGMIAGMVMTEELAMIENVSLQLDASIAQSANQMMSPTGEYAFSDLQMHQDYGVSASKEDNYLNGVSTLDLVLIQRHILGLERLDSPYKIIAADVNASEDVSAIDLIELRKLILGIYDELPDNAAWRFVESAYQFADPMHPWPFSEKVQLNNFSFDVMDANFYGVKIGDVNGSVILNTLGNGNQITGSTFDVAVETEITDKGNTRVSLVAQSSGRMAGSQFALNFDALTSDLIAAIPMELNIDNSNIAWDDLGSGQLKVSWNDSRYIDLQKGDVLMEFLFEGDKVEESLRINSDILKAEAYIETDDHIYTTNLNLISSQQSLAEDFIVYQNVPNPFSETTTIGFVLPTKGNVTIEINNAAGQRVFRTEKEFKSGYNEYTLDQNVLNTTGILYYKLSTANHSSTRKMIVLR